MTERNYEADLAVCAAATPGPWEEEGTSLVNRQEGIPDDMWDVCEVYHPDNRDFIRLAREALPWYIQRLQQAELVALHAEFDRAAVLGELFLLRAVNATLQNRSKVYIVVSEPYHDNSSILGVFSTLEKAKASQPQTVFQHEGHYITYRPGAVAQALSEDDDTVIYALDVQ